MLGAIERISQTIKSMLQSCCPVGSQTVSLLFQLMSGIHADSFKRVEGFAQPQPEPFAVEAKFFAEIRLLNRDVKIRIEDADDFGNIYGTVIHPNGNAALLLLRNGFAKIQEWGMKLVEHPQKYREALKEAQQLRVRKWRVS